ncbi:MAG: helix-turn-helix transcriptional regulator [Rugosibacter sp.]|nr:helix-turn-helix transcriptional regulator [Rugosibacter sp.]
MSIGLRLKEERELLRLSRTDFATKVGIHRNTQARYESGTREPDAAYWETVRALGVDVDYVINEHERKKRHSLGDRNPDSALLARVIESVETVLANSGLVLDPDKKARTVVLLYNAFRESGSVDFQLVKDAISLAGK